MSLLLASGTLGVVVDENTAQPRTTELGNEDSRALHSCHHRTYLISVTSLVCLLNISLSFPLTLTSIFIYFNFLSNFYLSLLFILVFFQCLNFFKMCVCWGVCATIRAHRSWDNLDSGFCPFSMCICG